MERQRVRQREPGRRAYVRAASAFGANDRIAYGLIAHRRPWPIPERQIPEAGRAMRRVVRRLRAEPAKRAKETIPGREDVRRLQGPARGEDGRRGDRVARSPACPDAVCRAGRQEGRLPREAAVEVARGERQDRRTVRKSKQIVQIGMQRRSAESMIKAKKLVDDGVLGQITLVKPQWHWNIAKELDNSPLPGKLDWERFLGGAKKRAAAADAIPQMALLLGLCRRQHDRPGHAPDGRRAMVHEAVRTPTSAVCSRLCREDEGRGTPGRILRRVRVSEHDGELDARLRQLVSRTAGRSQFMGDKGTMILDEYGYKVYRRAVEAGGRADLRRESSRADRSRTSQNFLDCMKSRNQPNCTVDIAARAVAGPHLANLAMLKKSRSRLPDGLSRRVKLADDAFHRTAGGSVELFRHASAEIRQAAGDDGMLHRFGHDDGVFCRRDRSVHQARRRNRVPSRSPHPMRFLRRHRRSAGLR